jgi:hypothetical protein
MVTSVAGEKRLSVGADFDLRPHLCVSSPEENLYVKHNIHRKKRFATFPSPAGMSHTKLSLGGYNLIIPAQVW